MAVRVTHNGVAPDEQVELESIESIQSPAVTHLRYRVVR